MEQRKKFNTQLKGGNSGEIIIAKKLKEWGWDLIRLGNTKDWDILLKRGTKEITIEVKTDRYEKFKGQTGNMMIEVQSWGKLSGIAVTKADYYVYFFPEREIAYFIKTEKIKDIIKLCPRVKGGDKKSSIGYLVNVAQWESHFKKMNIKKDPSIWNKMDRDWNKNNI